MALPNQPIYASTVYASPSLPPQMAAANVYGGPSPFTPTMIAGTPRKNKSNNVTKCGLIIDMGWNFLFLVGYYPPMGAMQMMSNGQPVMIQQQPYPTAYRPTTRRQRPCDECCHDSCACCLES